jgi:hypothetical protein
MFVYTLSKNYWTDRKKNVFILQSGFMTAVPGFVEKYAQVDWPHNLEMDFCETYFKLLN